MPSDTEEAAYITVVVTPAEKQKIASAADRDNRTVSQWSKIKLLKAAERKR